MPFIDMRKEMVNWLRSHGHWLAVRVAQPGKKCRCVFNETRATNSTCRRCFGTGKAYVDHLVKGDKRMFSPDLVMDTKVGEALMGEFRYYVEYVVPVKRDDFVLELELDPETMEPLQPYKIQEAYRIKQVDDMRDGESVGLSGRLEFLQLQVETVSVI
jgi:hypothetical protein